MKKKNGHLVRWSIVLIIVAVFLTLSLSDVVRLNPQLEGVSAAKLASTAKESSEELTLDVLIPAEEVPAEQAQAPETPEEFIPQGETVTVSDTEYYLVGYEDFVSYGGELGTDKFGDPKTLEFEGATYAVGTITETETLWKVMSTWEKIICTTAVAFTPLLIAGALLLVIGIFWSISANSKAAGISAGEYLSHYISPKIILHWISDNAIIVGIVLLAVGVSIFRPNFVSEANFRNLLSNTAVRFIIAVGVSGCLITKGTDLSAGRMTGLAACISAILLQRAGDYSSKFYPGVGNLPVLPMLLIVLIICAAIGAVNGSVIAFFKVPPFIATLGMQTLVYGACLVYTGAQPIGNLQSAYTGIALGYVGNRIFSYIAIIAFVVGLIMWFLYNKTRYGKYMYAIGGNETAAEVAGINTTKMKIKIYTLAALLYGLTGFLMAAKSGGASVNTAQGYELEAIAGCTIGGVSVNGGVGRISGILIGVLVFELLKIALQFLGIESSYTYIAQGLVIIVAVALDLRKYLAKK